MSTYGQKVMDNLLAVRVTAMYCVKCRRRYENVKAQQVHMKNGILAYKGICNTCGIGMYKIDQNRTSFPNNR